MQRPFLLPAALLGLMCTPVLAGINLGFLDYSPIRYFTEADWALENQAFSTAMNEKPNGETVEWSNPETDNGGSITPINRGRNNVGHLCRAAKIVVYSSRHRGEYKFRFCREDNGEWKIVERKPPKAAK